MYVRRRHGRRASPPRAPLTRKPFARRRATLAQALAFLMLLACKQATAGDSCGPIFPPALRVAVEKQFPGYRLPAQTANNADDVQYNLAHGGTGCLGAVSGDFDRDGHQDVAFLAESGADVFLMAALWRKQGWVVQKLWLAGESSLRSRLYVDVAGSGKYDDLGLTDELEPGQVNSFLCESQVIVTGMTESTVVAFCKGESGWVHVWISD
jgi:hypothetical protein